jgi:hypothetical protein
MSGSNSYLRSAAAALLDLADDVGSWLSYLFVWLLEALQRWFLRLDPRLYSEAFRIQEVTEGLARYDSGKFAVFVLYANAPVPSFTMSFIAALNRRSFNVVIVANAALDETSKERLLRHCCLYIQRVNLGRDFGGYRDGVNLVLQRFPRIEKLIVANDSVYYLEAGLDRLVAELDGADDFVGISEVFEHHYHVASFLIAFGPSVLGDAAFREFWSSYRPISTRMWAILEGEGALTKRLIDAGHRPRILYKAEDLAPKLSAIGARELPGTVNLLSAPVREELLEKANLSGHCEDAARHAFVQAMIDAIKERNQMHAAGFLFMKFLDLPLLKRDLVFRELFSAQEAADILSDLGVARPEIVEDLAGRPAPARVDVLRRMQFRHGFL